MIYPFELLVADLAQMNVFIPLDGADPVELSAEKITQIRKALRPAALSGFEKLVGLGAFGVHEQLGAEEVLELHAGWERREAIARLAEQEYQRLRAVELARARVLQEKVAQRSGGERLVGGDAIFDEPEQVPAIWGVGNFVLRAAGQGTMIAAQQGLGKTTIAQQVVLHRIGVRHGDFLGYPVRQVEEGEAVLYFAGDRPVQAMGSFRRMMPVGEGLVEQAKAVLSRKLLVWKGPLPFNAVLEPEALADWVQEMGDKRGVRVVDLVVDSVKDMAGGASLSRDETGGALNLAWQEVLARGVDLFLLHHQRKAAGGESRTNTLDDVFGSTLLTSGLGSVFALAGESGGAVVELSHLKQPLEPVEMRLVHDHPAGVTTVGEGVVGDVTVEGLLEMAAGKGMTVEELCMALHGQYSASIKKGVARALAALAKSGVAKKVSGGNAAGGKQPDVWYFQGLSL